MNGNKTKTLLVIQIIQLALTGINCIYLAKFHTECVLIFAIFGLYPFLLLCCWFVVELCKITQKALWKTASFILCFQMTCTVIILIQKTSASIVICLVLTEGRPPGQRPSLSHAAIRQKNTECVLISHPEWQCKINNDNVQKATKIHIVLCQIA